MMKLEKSTKIIEASEGLAFNYLFFFIQLKKNNMERTLESGQSLADILSRRRTTVMWSQSNL